MFFVCFRLQLGNLNFLYFLYFLTTLGFGGTKILQNGCKLIEVGDASNKQPIKTPFLFPFMVDIPLNGRLIEIEIKYENTTTI